MDFTECAHSISPAKNKHSAATHRSAAAKQARTFCAAHVKSSFIARSFSAVSAKASVVGASAALGRGRAQQKGDFFRLSLASTFVRSQLVIQQVISLDFFMKALMQQPELRMLGRLDAPSVVHPSLIAMCKTYRQAVQLCWQMRRVRNMTKKTLAEIAGLYAPHVTCYLSDDAKTRRDLPGGNVKLFEAACGNTAISQLHAMNAKLTCVEEMQARAQEAA
jgi:hypothetical protein